MQAILSKLASETVTLTTDSGLNVCISKTDKFSDVHEEQSTAAINCRITKPELINACKAEFHYSINEKKYVATLDIPSEFVEEILHCAMAKVPVDIEFEYFEKINQERKYTGCLTAFQLAKKVELETVTEDLFLKG